MYLGGCNLLEIRCGGSYLYPTLCSSCSVFLARRCCCSSFYTDCTPRGALSQTSITASKMASDDVHRLQTNDCEFKSRHRNTAC